MSVESPSSWTAPRLVGLKSVRWSLASEPWLESPSSIAELPGAGSIVAVGPPLSWRKPSRGSPDSSKVPLRLQLLPSSRL
jgi:hypothetical protein